MKLTRLCFFVICFALMVEADTNADGSEPAMELGSDATNNTQASEDAVALASLSTPSPTGEASSTTTEDTSHVEELRRGGVSVSTIAVPSPRLGVLFASCSQSIPASSFAILLNGRLDVLQNIANREACCDRCRRFSEPGLLQCRSWYRDTGDNRPCYLNRRRFS
eukprot:g3746.t1